MKSAQQLAQKIESFFTLLRESISRDSPPQNMRHFPTNLSIGQTNIETMWSSFLNLIYSIRSHYELKFSIALTEAEEADLLLRKYQQIFKSFNAYALASAAITYGSRAILIVGPYRFAIAAAFCKLGLNVIDFTDVALRNSKVYPLHQFPLMINRTPFEKTDLDAKNGREVVGIVKAEVVQALGAPFFAYQKTSGKETRRHFRSTLSKVSGYIPYVQFNNPKKLTAVLGGLYSTINFLYSVRLPVDKRLTALKDYADIERQIHSLSSQNPLFEVTRDLLQDIDKISKKK